MCPRRSRWEREQPFWFDDAWKARIPLKFLQGLEQAAAAPVSSQQTTFREAVRDVEPWCLDARQLLAWLEEHWVSSETAELREQRKRRKLVQLLSDADGFELLTACTTKVSKVPWVTISQTKSRKVIRDRERAGQLTAFAVRVRHGHGTAIDIVESRRMHHAARIAMIHTLSMGRVNVQLHTTSWSRTTSPIVYHATHHRSTCAFARYHTRSAALHTHRNVKERKRTWEFIMRVEHQQC